MKRLWVMVLLLMGAICYCAIGMAQQTTSHDPLIKVAILDNFSIERYAKTYTKHYFEGVSAAKLSAKSRHYQLQIKSFTYEDTPLAILNAITEVKAWHPDVIIGPHYSNQFLLLNNQFHHVLVLSPYASDIAINTMSKNFYNLAVTDAEMAHATKRFMETYFPKKNIYNITQIDCKDCIDTTKNLMALYQSSPQKITLQNSNYIGSDLRTLDIVTLMQHYHPGDVIILQPLNEIDAATLMQRITAYLPKQSFIFVHNLDNWGMVPEASTSHPVPKNTTLYRVSALVADQKTTLYRNFSQDYFHAFHRPPHDTVSYMTYRSLSSVIAAMQHCNTMSTTLKQKILLCYLRARKQDPNWFRARYFGIYRQQGGHEHRIARIPVAAP